MVQQTVSLFRDFAIRPPSSALYPLTRLSLTPRYVHSPARRVDPIGREGIVHVYRGLCAHLERRARSGYGHEDEGDGRQG